MNQNNSAGLNNAEKHRQEMAELRAEVERLGRERDELESSLNLVIQHGDDIEAELARTNQRLRGEVEQRRAKERHLTRLSTIGIALSSEQNLPLLLEKIVDEARDFAGADAGTLYLVNDEEQSLEFAIIQNESMGIRMGGSSQPISWPAVPMVLDGEKNHANVSSHTAISGEIVNIPDVYRAEGFDFSGTKKFDQGTGYRSQSMLVIPMRNKDREIIGVLQLINSLNQDGNPVPFSPENIDLIASLASQAAVAITNVRLYQDLEHLFDAFIQAIAAAIDEKSPYTGGHIRRVQELTMIIARAMNEENEGFFKDFFLNEEQMRELSIAAWLHDIGKIVTPEYVVDKASKLETIFDRIHLVSARYELRKRELQLKACSVALQNEAVNSIPSSEELEKKAKKHHKLEEELARLEEEKEFIIRSNTPGEFMDDEKIARLEEIAARKTEEEQHQPLLSPDELANLSIRKGTLNTEERKVIENHAAVTHKMLTRLPFPKRMQKVPEYAAAHHEKLNGSGYPFGLAGEQIALPARIIAIADIFEALTASDRPYKKPMQLSQALKILGFMVKDEHIDPEIMELFTGRKIYAQYAAAELKPEQIDC